MAESRCEGADILVVSYGIWVNEMGLRKAVVEMARSLQNLRSKCPQFFEDPEGGRVFLLLFPATPSRIGARIRPLGMPSVRTRGSVMVWASTGPQSSLTLHYAGIMVEEWDVGATQIQ